jgi:large subunit ribosomal protein L6
MSRIGKKPIVVPPGVTVTQQKSSLEFKGPHGVLTHQLPDGFVLEKKENELTLIRPSDERKDKSFHGLHRSLIANKIQGVNDPFKKILELVGIGYRAQLNGAVITLNVGFTHPVEMPLPNGVKASIEKQTVITLTCSDKQLLGQFAADIRGIKPPEPYKGKGIKYSGEKILRKEGKTGKK